MEVTGRSLKNYFASFINLRMDSAEIKPLNSAISEAVNFVDLSHLLGAIPWNDVKVDGANQTEAMLFIASFRIAREQPQRKLTDTMTASICLSWYRCFLRYSAQKIP